MEYILEQVSEAGTVRAQKMFGEYALYCNEKVVALVCDDQLYVKFTDPGKAFAEGYYSEGFPYPGAKPAMNLTDKIDDREFITTLIRLTVDALPIPKPKKRKKQA
jgi:TfoX/Sxy family transcriptional regulator of competence genes